MIKKNINIAKEINTIVDAMQHEILITNIIESATSTTLEVETITIFDNLAIVFELQKGMIIEINEKNYEVANVQRNVSTDIILINSINISGSSYKVAANFKAGSRIEINQILSKDADKLNRFPLIWLITPIEQNFKDEGNVDFESELNIVFAHKSNSTDRAYKRLEGNIDKIIHPLIKYFQLWLKSSDFNYIFEFYKYDENIDLKQTSFPFYGNDEKTKNVLNTFTDAVEVSANLSFKKQY